MEPAVNSWLFKLWRFLGSIGFFKYDGLRGNEPEWWPKARVLYPECKHSDEMLSVPMGIGNACSYARIFNAKVVPVDHKIKV
jgi:hypothetical protein